ncbi:zinc finger, CCHC-type containing protein [Tanacetum coccineum]
MRLRLFQFSLCGQASNWIERLLARSITTWEDLTTRFLAQFFPPGRIVKLRNDILMFQQHPGESLSEAWTHFKDLLQKVPHHGIDQLMTSRAPEKVLIREEAKFPVTKNVNSISLTRGEEERSEKTNVTTGDDFEKPTKTEMEMPIKEAKKEDKAENEPNKKI